MSRQSPLSATSEQKSALAELAGSELRGEADRGRAILLTLSGWTSPEIAEAFGVTTDSVRHWRQWLAEGGVEALRSTLAPGPSAEKGETRSVGGGRGTSRTGGEPDQLDLCRDHARRSNANRHAHFPFAPECPAQARRGRGFRWRRPRHTLKGRQDADEVDRIGLHLQIRRQQARAGDIVLLHGDESEALTHPYLAHAWAERGADLRIAAPG
jgi:hypothetical protein